jgi:ribosomal protein S18 acetylase RimI-like enzyme
MICTAPVTAQVPDGVEIRTVTTVEGVHHFATLTGAAYSIYGMPADAPVKLMSRPERVLAAPHLVTVVAYRDGEPLAGAMTLLSHGIAGLYWVGTVEKARRSGLGRAVTAAVTNIAFDRGAAAVTLQASVMGEPVYRSMGYRSLYHYEDWTRLQAPRTLTARP